MNLKQLNEALIRILENEEETFPSDVMVDLGNHLKNMLKKYINNEVRLDERPCLTSDYTSGNDYPVVSVYGNDIYLHVFPNEKSLDKNLSIQVEFEPNNTDEIFNFNELYKVERLIKTLTTKKDSEFFYVDNVEFQFKQRPDGLVQITQIRPYSMQDWSWAIGRLEEVEGKDYTFGNYKINRDRGDTVETLIRVRGDKEDVAKAMLLKDKDLSYMPDRT